MSEIFSKILKDKNGKVLNVGSRYQQPEWGVDTTTIVDILPEAEYTIMSADEPISVITSPVSHALVAGNTYEVIYNGTSYNCTCVFEDDGAGGGSYALGNLAAAGGEGYPDTGEPFMIGYFDEKGAEANGFYGMIAPLDGSTTFTLSIRGASGEIHAIPTRYIEAPLIVEVTTPNGNNYQASNTFDEVYEAIESGRTVYVDVYGDRYFMASRETTYIQFIKLGDLATLTEVIAIKIGKNANGSDSVTRHIYYLSLSEK